MKRILTIILAVLVMVLPMTTVFAAEETFTLGTNVTGVLDTDTGVLTISGTGEMSDYDTPDGPFDYSPAYDYNASIKTIVIESGVTSIGNHAFHDLSLLTSVTIPKSVTSIGENAFYDCINLKTIINLYDGVQTIGASAFTGAGSSVAEKTAYLYDTNTAFATATSDAGYTLVNGIPLVFGENVSGVLDPVTGMLTISGTGDMWQYRGNSPVIPYIDDIKSIVIENGVTTIGDEAFINCSNLTSITIPESVTYIRSCALKKCTSLESIIIPKNVTSIGFLAFAGCSNLATITNLYDGIQTVESNIFGNDSDGYAGSSVATKTAVCLPANTTFAVLAEQSGYAILGNSTGTGDVEATVPVSGSIDATTISVTHPASVAYTIDPNLGYEDGAFVAPDIAITNNSAVPINVTVESLSSATGGTLQFADVAADAYLWADLSVTESKAYIALGVKISDGTGWNTGYTTDTRYAVDTGDTLFGSLAAGASGRLDMTANYGLAFDQNYTAVHNLVFMFDMA